MGRAAHISLIARPIRLFYRAGPWQWWITITVLSLGLASSSVAYVLLRALSYDGIRGDIRSQVAATIGAASTSGPLQPISWNDLMSIRATGLKTEGYARAVSVQLRWKTRAFSLRMGATSVALPVKFALPLVSGEAFHGLNSEGPPDEAIVAENAASTIFGGAAQAVGQIVEIGGRPVRIVGVVALPFRGIYRGDTDIWFPPRLYVEASFAFGLPHPDSLWSRVPCFLGVVSKKDGSFRLASEQLQRAQHGAPWHGPGLTVSEGPEDDPGHARLVKAWCGIGFCVAALAMVVSALAVSGMLIGRLDRTAQEVRLKRILGATTLRIATDLLSGPLVLNALGAGLAFLVAAVSVRGVQTWLNMPELREPFAFRLSIAMFVQCIVTAALMGLVPMTRLWKDSGIPLMGHGALSSRLGSRTLEGVVAGEVLFCLCATVVASSVLMSVIGLTKLPLGYSIRHESVLMIGVTGQFRYSTSSDGKSTLGRALEGIQEQVASSARTAGVAVATAAPMEPPSRPVIVAEVDGKPTKRSVSGILVTPGYFRILHTRVLLGRDLWATPAAGDPSEAVVNRSFVKEFWSRDEAIGRSLAVLVPTTGVLVNVRVVGIVEDQRLAGPESEPGPVLYLPLSGNLLADAFPLYLLTPA